MASPARFPREVAKRAAPLPTVTLLICLPSRWKEFPGSLQAALAPAGPPLEAEQNLGGMARRWLGASALAHLLTLTLLVWFVPKLPLMMPVVLDERPRHYTAIYYQAPSLPQMEDSRPGAAVASARRGEEYFHPTQIIRIRRGSVLRPKVVDAPDPALSRVSRATANLLAVPALAKPVMPLLQAPAAPVEVHNTKSRIARPSAATDNPAPAADLSKLRPSTQLPSLAGVPVSPVTVAAPEKTSNVPQQTTASSVSDGPANTPDAPAVSTAKLPTVIMSAEPGNEVAIPVDGGPGTLPMSPQGRAAPHANGEGGDPAAHASAGPVSSANGHGNAASPGANLSPGVTVRGGVVSLDSFGPRTGPSQPGVVTLESFGPKPPAVRPNGNPRNAPSDPPRKPAPIVVVASARSGGGLNSYGTFKTSAVYTIYFQTAAGMAVFQFAEHEPSNSYQGDLTPPDPLSSEIPPAPSRNSGIVISCLLDATGHVQNIRTIQGVSAYAQEVAEAVRSWRFHPALMAGEPVAVDVLIGIGVSVR